MGEVVLVGRDRERRSLRDELDRARSGEPRVVLVEGEPGMGKTALLRRFVSDLEPGQVLVASGDPSEREVPFAVVDQLMRGAGRGSMESMSLDLTTSATDPILVGAALLAAFGELQAEDALVLVVDDAHWADLPSLQALTFALRRLAADRVLAVFATRPGQLAPLAAAISALADSRGRYLPLEGLSPEDVQSMASISGVEALLPRDARRLQEHTGGNPLHVSALLEEWTPEEMGGRRDAPLPAPRSYADIISARLAAFSDGALRWIRAASVIGIHASLIAVTALAGFATPFPSGDEAVDSGLVEIYGEGSGMEVAFHHPLSHSAVYHAIPAGERSELHRRAAALATDEQTRLRHLVLAATGPDDDLAAELESFSTREAARGAWASAVWGVVAASGAAASDEDRERRVLIGIEYAISAGDAGTVGALAPKVAAFVDTPRRRFILGLLAAVSGRQKEAEELLRGTWEALGDPPSDPELAKKVGGWLSPLIVNQGRSSEVLDWARTALSNLPDSASGVPNLGMVLIAFGGTGDSDEGLSLVEGLSEQDEPEVWSTELLMGRGLLRFWKEDFDGALDDLERVGSITRERGPFVDFLISLFYRSDLEYRAGRWDDAITHGELAASIGEDADQPWVLALVHGVAAFPLASRGEWEPAERHARLAAAAAEQLGDLAARIWAAMAQGRLAHARRDFAAVADAFVPLLGLEHTEGLWDPGIQPWEALYAEALIRLDRLEEGEAVLDHLEARLGETGLPSARADAARVRGFVHAAHGRDDAAAAAFERGLEVVRTIDRPFLEGRNELAYGEFLRRRGKRAAAAKHLESAKGRFEQLRARPYVEWTDAELAACGLTPKPRGEQTTSFTPQELAVATLVSEGRSNREAAAELVVSVKTVEYHLGHVFAKLGVRSRSQLTRKMFEQLPV